MKQILFPLASVALLLFAQPAFAGCYADYKAKQDSPLRLHYGVMQISGSCTAEAARGQIASRLASHGWTLLNVITVFEDSGLEKRKANAGQYFLRF